jgi:hypothetical protein
MGDRANIYVKNTPSTGVYLYTHWRGSELAVILRDALARKLRWNDDSYLTRILFDQMTKGETGEETGFGIGTSPPDNEHPLLVVDCDQRTVSVQGCPFDPDEEPELRFTFDEYLAITEDPREGVEVRT